jgi:DNA modification methylase
MTLEIHNEDCLITMKNIPDKYIDLLITDPPYNAKNIGPNHREYNVGQMQLPAEEYIKFCKTWFKEAQRVAKRIVFTPVIANVCYYPQSDWIACWHKPASVSFNRFGGFNAWEPIMLYGKIPKGKRLPQDYILFNTLNFSKGIEREHPCPKPLEFIKKLINIFSLEDEIIYDPFLGSGTTAIACLDLKRKFIGSEISERYCELCAERIKNFENQPKLKI